MDREQIPIFSYRLKKIVEEFIKLWQQIFSYSNNVLPQLNFMFLKTLTDLLLNIWLSQFYFVYWVTYLLLDCLLKVKLVERVYGNYWVQQMIRVKAVATYSFLAFETHQDKLFIMNKTFIFIRLLCKFGCSLGLYIFLLAVVLVLVIVSSRLIERTLLVGVRLADFTLLIERVELKSLCGTYVINMKAALSHRTKIIIHF